MVNVNDILSELKQMFGGGQSFTRPVKDYQPQTQEQGFTAPIHGNWYNLGGFSTTSPNPRHPKGHLGLDMSCSAGTPIYAMGPGVVSNVGTDHDGGNVVGVTHANGLWSYYAHMSTVKVQKGDKVNSNTVVGTVGNTGNAQGGFPHLHFGVKEHGGWIDPARFFSVPKYNADYAKNPTKYVPKWTSEQSKQEAMAFNMKDHLADRRSAFASEVAKLSKIASDYYELATRS